MLMSNCIDYSKDQLFLLPPSLHDWMSDDDLAHFILEAVEHVDMSAFSCFAHGFRQGAISSPDDACFVDLLLCERYFFIAQD